MERENELRSDAIISSDQAEMLVANFADRFRDFTQVTAESGKATLMSRCGGADLAAKANQILIAVSAKHDNPRCHYELRIGTNIELGYLYREGRQAGTTRLVSEASGRLEIDDLADNLYFWAGCEFGELRRLARRSWRLPRERHLVVSFWRRDFAEGEALGADARPASGAKSR
jgi:hypothetical protein